jgi:carbonic anhydrase/acetyltransferase-like protein (isoleucine patch superfamily)
MFLCTGVYLSSGATVLGNIHVGEGSVVNAGSVVTKTTPPYCRVGGVPAGIISKFSVDPESIESMNNEKFEIPRELTGQGEDEEPIKFSSFNIDFQGDLESRTGMS